MVLPDKEIRRLAMYYSMIFPFTDYLGKGANNGKINTGLSSCGYDFTLDREFVIFDAKSEIDPKQKMDHKKLLTSNRYSLNPSEMILGQTAETFTMPDDVMGVVYTRSTYARSGIFLNVTPIEPGWRGQITLEISNISHSPVWIYPGESIGQIVFMRIAERPEMTYADKGGKYQNQYGVTGPIVK